jgi:hypothetical protein
MKVLVILVLFIRNVANAYSYNEVLRDYQAKRYEKVCSEGAEFYMRNDKNEQILVAIGDACAKIDAINPL